MCRSVYHASCTVALEPLVSPGLLQIQSGTAHLPDYVVLVGQQHFLQGLVLVWPALCLDVTPCMTSSRC